MHEMSIATELLRQVLEAAAEHGAGCVEKVVVRCGVLRQVVPEALDAAFTAAARGTTAEDATLEMEEEPAEARCRRCGESFRCRVDNYLCPTCNQADVEIVRGNQILLMSVVCRELDGAST